MMITKNPEVTPMTRRGEFPVAFKYPWSDFQEMRRGMDDLFSRYFGYTPLSHLIPDEAVAFEPMVEIYETSEELLFFIAVPGFELKNIEVNVNADVLHVHGVRKPWYVDMDESMRSLGRVWEYAPEVAAMLTGFVLRSEE